MARDELLPMAKYFLAGSAALHAPAPAVSAAPGDLPDGPGGGASGGDSSDGEEGDTERASATAAGGGEDDGSSVASSSAGSGDASLDDDAGADDGVEARPMRRVLVFMDSHASECALRQQSREGGAGVYSPAFLQVGGGLTVACRCHCQPGYAVRVVASSVGAHERGANRLLHALCRAGYRVALV